MPSIGAASTLEHDLNAAFAREGIAYPAERLAEAVADYADLHRFMSLVEESGLAAREAGAGEGGCQPSETRALPGR